MLRAAFADVTAFDAPLTRFSSDEPPEVTESHRAIEQFNADVPTLAAELRAIIEEQYAANAAFRQAVGEFLELGADVALNVRETTPGDRLQAVRDLTGGRGADVVVECAGVPEVVTEGLDMLRPGGFYIESGNFSDMGSVSIKPHLICAKNLRIIGIGGEAITAYGPSLEAFRRYRRHYPLHKFVSHRFPLDQAEAALRFSTTDDCLKVAIASPELLPAQTA